MRKQVSTLGTPPPTHPSCLSRVTPAASRRGQAFLVVRRDSERADALTARVSPVPRVRARVSPGGRGAGAQLSPALRGICSSHRSSRSPRLCGKPEGRANKTDKKGPHRARRGSLASCRPGAAQSPPGLSERPGSERAGRAQALGKSSLRRHLRPHPGNSPASGPHQRPVPLQGCMNKAFGVVRQLWIHVLIPVSAAALARLV